jgi:Flp pilus assembly protein TadD
MASPPRFVALAALSSLALVLAATAPTLAVDTTTPKDALDLAGARAKVKAEDWDGAIAELRALADRYQHADVYNLLGFAHRKRRDFAAAATWYAKALDFDPDHKGALEYQGELHLETGELAKAKANLARLERLCPTGCEEREDLSRAIAAHR